jgi:hypothetical protein
MMQIRDGVAWYSKEELFVAIHAQRLALDEAQFEDWQKKGIVPLGRRIGRGRKKGVAGVWSEAQVALVRKVCELRQQQGVRSVVAQCNVPVWAWLYLGEASGVDLMQVKRVMWTWVQRQTVLSKKEAKERARELVEIVGNDMAPGQRQARRAITSFLYACQEEGVGQKLEDALWDVYTEERQANGPDDIALTPQLLRLYEQSRRFGLDILMQKNILPDQRWWWARHIQLQAVTGYAEQQQQYKQETAGTVVAGLFSIDLAGTLVASACEDVVLALGMEELLLGHKNRGVRDRFGVDEWMERVKSVRVEAELVMSPLVLLNGTHPGGLRIREVMTL